MAKVFVEKAIVNAQTVTASDTVDQPFVSNSIFCTSAGTVRVEMYGAVDGTTIDYAMSAGDRFPLRVKKIYSTGTTGAYIIEE